MPPRFLYLPKSIIINALFPPNSCLSIMITQQNPQPVTTNLDSVYLLFCTQAAQQDLGTQWPREHCCPVTSLKVFQHQELRLTSILLNQLHFPFSSANDSKSAPFAPLFPGACLAIYLIHPLNHSSIHSNMYWVPTMCQVPCQGQTELNLTGRTF